jgi:succinoglycan biosynthesis protein ExoL
MKILFALSHQPNPRFIKQINYLSINGFQVSVVYFYRDYLADLNENIDKEVQLFSLTTIENGKYFSRVFTYARSILTLKGLLFKIKPDKILINNIDIMFLLITCMAKRYTSDIIMEISDLRSYTFNSNVISAIQRSIDKVFLNNYLSKMIFTSKKFYNFYYYKAFQKKVFILENKPLLASLPEKINKNKNKKTTIGIVGLLLQGKAYQTLLDIVKTNNNFELHIYGRGGYQATIEKYSNSFENIRYFGGYDFFKDIANIYSNIDILYMPYDTTNGDLNNKLALPNKLYEAMYFKVPIITSSGTYLGDLVENYNIGVTVECCNSKELISVISEMDIHSFKEDFDIIDPKVYTADSDYVKLIKFINS